MKGHQRRNESVAREEFFARLEKLTPAEFEVFVTEIIRSVDEFSNIEGHVQSGSTGIDILARYSGSEYASSTIAFEVKKTLIGTADLIHHEIARRDLLRRSRPGIELILVISGKLTTNADKIADAYKLPVWDPVYLWELARPGILAYLSLSQPDASPPVATGELLKTRMSQIPSGNKNALEYQLWVKDTFEYLFPTLSGFHYEDVDDDQRNRRDLIIENWDTDGFWEVMRSSYSAYLIVVDAKNSGKPLLKRPVLEVAHYLKRDGCGLFGILVSPSGAGPAARHAIREIWRTTGKLIVSLDHSDIGEMLTQRDAGAKAEPYLQRKIADFRKLL